MRSRIVLLALACGLGAHGARAANPSPSPDFPADSLRAWVAWLADDARDGRGPGTPGLDAAAEFIAARFRGFGLQPGGDGGTFFQEFEATTGVRAGGRNALRVAGRDLGFETDWVAYGFSDTGTTRAGVTFAGYGITAPEYAYDDYAGLDVQGKIALVLLFEPGRNDSTSAFEGKLDTPHSEIRRKAILAREHGAVGLLAVTGPRLDTTEDALARLKPDVGYYSAGIPCGHVKRAALGAALPGFDLMAMQEAIDTTGKPVRADLGSAEVAWSVGLVKERTKLRNVVGTVAGADAHRALVIGAHYDHLGFGGPSSLAPDEHAVHNGADDNASGTAVLLGLARWFASQPRPAETMVFVAFSGEEMGLVGSGHYVKHPAYPLEFTSAMLNMDMVGRLRDRKLDVFGTETASEWTTILNGANGEGPQLVLKMRGDGYGPSDQMSFYKKDVPVLHFFTGAHSDYHKPSDDAARLDYDGMSAIADFIADVAIRAMDRPVTFVRATAPAPAGDAGSGGGGFKASLGLIPDYSQDENLKGVLLSGVRAKGPAEEAGLKGGDVVVQIDAMKIDNIYDLMHVLNTRRPGEQVALTVVRGGERQTFQAVLGKGR